MKKTLSKKSCDTVPLKYAKYVILLPETCNNILQKSSASLSLICFALVTFFDRTCGFQMEGFQDIIQQSVDIEKNMIYLLLGIKNARHV